MLPCRHSIIVLVVLSVSASPTIQDGVTNVELAKNRFKQSNKVVPIRYWVDMQVFPFHGKLTASRIV